MATATDLLAPDLWNFGQAFREYVRDEHGQFAPTGGAGLNSPEAIGATFERTDEPTGLSTKVTRISTVGDETEFYGYSGWTRVEIGIKDSQGRNVGHGDVLISPDGKTVHHKEFVLRGPVQGQGFATRQMVHVVDSYRRHGVKTMTLTADADVGGYAWARAGFRFGEPGILVNGRDGIAEIFRTASHKKRYAAVRDEMQRVASNPHAEPIDFAMIGHSPGATMWPGKELMLKAMWSGRMDL